MESFGGVLVSGPFLPGAKLVFGHRLGWYIDDVLYVWNDSIDGNRLRFREPRIGIFS